ncbi:MAG TPA: hypothetical protein PKV71_20685 [Calditrichia bacterium]|nr:hypothetical protein [Calditrichota bacterium]HQU71946.1 hypothetical protein [Calditrichia bacterium]HQV34318.1 hypothetical protein [Calditrichia bacterium]
MDPAADDYTWSRTAATSILLNGNSISTSGTAVSVSGSIATITAGGTYRISGTLTSVSR